MIGWVCEKCGETHGRHPSRAEELVLEDCGLCGQRALCARGSTATRRTPAPAHCDRGVSTEAGRAGRSVGGRRE